LDRSSRQQRSAEPRIRLGKLRLEPSIITPIIATSEPPTQRSRADAEQEHPDDGSTTITPATIYEHYERVAQRLFRVLEKQPGEEQRALDWPLETAQTLDELPISPTSSLMEYQLTEEWFESVVRELREAEESRAAVGGGGGVDGAG